LQFAELTSGFLAVNGTICSADPRTTLQIQRPGRRRRRGARGGWDTAGGDLSYRVDASAKNVSVSDQEGRKHLRQRRVGSANSQRSCLRPRVSTAHGFNPRTDVSPFWEKLPSPSYTVGRAVVACWAVMQFRFHVETAARISFESSVAQDLQVEGDPCVGRERPTTRPLGQG